MDELSRRDVLEWAMAESVPVRCPACRREHLFAAPSYPCVCGAPVTPPLDHLADPAPVTHRTWEGVTTALVGQFERIVAARAAAARRAA